MASTKRIGFFWGEEKITIVDFDKNLPLKVVSSPLGSKTGTPSPFSSNLTEEIQITAILQKMLQDHQIKGVAFYVSLPMKEIILRSFIIPMVKDEEIQSAIKFEAKKYMPFDIQDLTFVFHTIPFSENQTKRLQVIFFAARKEVLARYDRIFKQVNAEVAYCEPYMVSLTKSLLFKKEIKTTDHLAFLILEKTLGRICFIDEGIPQFIREFPLASPTTPEEAPESSESLNLKIVNEVGNSFDFYARQFNGERIEQMLVSSEFVQKDLLNVLETELKVKIKKISPVISSGGGVQSSDMDAVFAMGACVTPSLECLSEFNFLGQKTSKSKYKSIISLGLKSYKDIIILMVLCAACLLGEFGYFQFQIKGTESNYHMVSAKEGDFLSEPTDSVQSDVSQNTDLLNKYKGIRTKSDVSLILLKIASHLPIGAKLTDLTIKYDDTDSNKAKINIEMSGTVYKDDPNDEIVVANHIYSELKADTQLIKIVDKVELISLNSENNNGKLITNFTIHCSNKI